MINYQRLSRYITSRTCEKSKSVLLSMREQSFLEKIYESLSSSQRQEIKELLDKNKNE